MGARWRVVPAPDAAACHAMAAELSLPLALAGLLVQRGFDAAAARIFLRPPLDGLSTPHALAGMADAVTEVVSAVSRRIPILVHGDYDVDGQCAAALLTRALRIAGADVHAFVPHRVEDGYDFGSAGLAEAARIGAGLIITCDCGITAVEAVAQARSLGIRVVVTDHHLPGAVLPDADAVVDPQRADDTSGLNDLCGTGIVFKLVQALVEPLGLPAGLPFHFLDLVAMATVADVVPLRGENRILVKHGLRVLASSRWAGLRALVAATGLGGAALRAGQVGYILAPRLNAVGRIADAKDGLRLLLTDDDAEAGALAVRLEALNRERQALDQRILEQALEQVATHYADPRQHPAIVLASEGWHPGVIGIVASRVVERYGRPTFLIALDGETGKGSGRSITAFDLHGALQRCGDLLLRFGGHRMAAGLTIAREEVAAFRDRLNEVAACELTPDDLGPTQKVDLELLLSEVTPELEVLLRHLEPCGMGNPAPVFGVRGVHLQDPRVVGTNHLKGTLQGGSATIDAIAFGCGDQVSILHRGRIDAAFRLEVNEYRGRVTLQAKICALTEPT
ncbi:MAG: single-stranded-DNA-specific exonuclease RecJ [Gemmatimonadales bacterium]|nr:single-stranded-DNA-specific exonuclease RecJ [Gemmatimonadales bacterium]